MRKIEKLVTTLVVVTLLFGVCDASARTAADNLPEKDSEMLLQSDTLSFSEMMQNLESLSRILAQKELSTEQVEHAIQKEKTKQKRIQNRSEADRKFLPTRRRIDRQIDKNKFIYKGEVMLGLTASYGTISSEDSDFLLILEHIDADGTMATVKPFFGYAYSDNHVLGARFGYTYINGSIGNLGFNLGAQNDLSGALSHMGYKSDNFTFSLFHRSYVGLDPKGRFGLFAEFEGSVMVGTSRFDYMAGELPKGSNSNNFQAKLAFNPGMAVYVFPNVCATISFGLGGIQYSKVTQKNDAGEQVGSREASKMRFRLNLADINIGMTIHLWDKKKK